MEVPSLHSQQEQKALAALQIQRAAGAPSLVIQQPSAMLLLFITDLDSLQKAPSSCLTSEWIKFTDKIQ